MHFAHEERLMTAARYGSISWHQQQHDAARRSVEESVLRIELGDSDAGVGWSNT
jgi:hemerythrin